MLKHIAGMDSLHSLRLSNVTDDLLVELADSHEIRDLVLGSNSISDAGLAHLEGLTGLKELNLRQTAVTEAGARPLAKALPHAKIMFGITTIEPTK